MATWPSGKAEACKAFTPGSNPGVASKHADVAQLVEHDLAKVGVAGSNPVVRSNFTSRLRAAFFMLRFGHGFRVPTSSRWRGDPPFLLPVIEQSSRNALPL